MDYKYIEQLLERYWAAETSLEEERILRAFFSQSILPAEMEHLRPLFSYEAEEMLRQTLDDDFDTRLMQMIGAEEQPIVVKARRVMLTQRLMPFFKAAAVVAIILTLGNAAQAPWDNSWNSPEEYAAMQQNADTVVAVSPIQAENISEVITDSTNVLMTDQSKN